MGNWYLIHYKNRDESGFGTERVLAKNYTEAREKFERRYPNLIIQLIEMERGS